MNKRKAVFMDRDGVLCVEKRTITPPDKVIFYEFVKESISYIHNKGYLAIVITNQSGIARGLFAEEELIRLNQHMIDEFDLDAVYYCPHHPNGIVPRYSTICECRKPKTGMIVKACKDWNIDICQSFFVGDRASDIETGLSMGMKTVITETGYGVAGLEYPIAYDYKVVDLLDFSVGYLV